MRNCARAQLRDNAEQALVSINALASSASPKHSNILMLTNRIVIPTVHMKPFSTMNILATARDKGHKQLTSNSDSNTVRSPNVSVQKSRAFQPLCFPHQTLDIHAGCDTTTMDPEPTRRTPQRRSRTIEQFPRGQGNGHKTWALRQAARWTRCVPSFWKQVVNLYTVCRSSSTMATSVEAEIEESTPQCG